MSGVNIDIKLAPHCVDVRQYEDVQKTAMVGDLESTFNFCFVGELSKRKNISALLKAFYLEFHPTEPVNLLLKSIDPAPGLTTACRYLISSMKKSRRG